MSDQPPVKSLYARIDSLKREIERVTAKHHPYRSPEIVYRSLSSLLDENRRMLDEACELFTRADTDSRIRFAETVRTAERMTALLVDVFTSSDRADSPRIPFEILNALSVAAEVLIGYRCRVMVHLTPQYNYEIMSLRHFFEKNGWLDHWAGDENIEGTTTPTTILVMVFPSYEVTTILLHAAAAHELGHVLAEQLSDGFESIVTNAITNTQNDHLDEIEGWVNKQVIRREGESHEDAFKRGLKLFEEILAEVASGWSEEVFADLVAARLVGPPFLIALDRITLGEVASQDDDELSTHPSDGLRFEIVSRYLKEKLPHVYEDRVWSGLLQQRSSSVRTELLPRLAREVCNRCFASFALILDGVRSPLADKAILSRKLSEIRRLLADLAPPSAACSVNSKEEVADAFWLLFYASWHFRLHGRAFSAFRKRYGWYPKGEDVAAADKKTKAQMEKDEESKAEGAIGSLVLHSLQSLELRLLWSESHQSAQGVRNAP